MRSPCNFSNYSSTTLSQQNTSSYWYYAVGDYYENCTEELYVPCINDHGKCKVRYLGPDRDPMWESPICVYVHH